MKPMAPGSLAPNTKAATTIEFALVSVVLVAMLLGGIETGIMLWTRGTLQAIAALTARCAAISSPLCNNPNATPTALTPQLYAFNLAATLLGPGLVTTSDIIVSVSPTCINASPASTSFEVVTIESSGWFGLSPSAWFSSGFSPLVPKASAQNQYPDAVTACYPT